MKELHPAARSRDQKGESMFVVNNFMSAIAQLLDFLLTAYMWIIIGRAIISWVNADPYNPVVRFLYEATEPVLSRIRRWLPISFGSIDFSPMILILGIMFLQSFLVATLRQLAMRMG
jgi:YggT family protein